MENGHSYEILKKALCDPAFLQSLNTNPDQIIQQNGVTDPGEINNLKRLLALLISGVRQAQQSQEFVQQQLKTTSETADSFKTGLRKTIEQIDSGFRSTMLMYKVAFYLGVVLIIVAVYTALVDGITLLSIAFGGMGVLDFLAFFITKPAQNLQTSRADLAQLQAAFFNWFIDTYNWNSYLIHLNNTNQVEFSKCKEVSDILLANTDKTMSLIEQYCGFEVKR